MTQQSTIERQLADLVMTEDYRGDTVEVQGASFKVDKPYFWKDLRNAAYMDAETAWYDSTSPFVNDLFKIYGKPIKIWEQICDAGGKVNSNYGMRIYDTRYGCQYYNAKKALITNPLSRQALMIYQDPWMHQIAGRDFTCTNTVQYFMNWNDDLDSWLLDAHVYMRSNDAIFGFNNDYHWQKLVARRLAADLHTEYLQSLDESVTLGDIYWNAASFHVYSRHWDILREWSK